MEDCHIELGVMAHRPQLFHENLLLIRIINMSALDHETSTYDMLAITGKIHILREIVGSYQISLKKIIRQNIFEQSIESLRSLRRDKYSMIAEGATKKSRVRIRSQPPLHLQN